MMICTPPNTFYLDEDNVLFFNIFLKNNKIYVITPLYKENNYIINKNTLHITYESTLLKCSEQTTKNRNEPTQILIYDLTCFKSYL